MTRLVIALSIALAASRAHAQPSDNTALAEQLFNQGRELAKAGDWAAACPKFEASLRCDATLGTRLNLATCYEKIGRIASAWGHYRDAADLAGRTGDVKRRDYARQQAAALEPRLPKLTIAPPPGPPAAFSVTRDGVALDAGALGTALYVDPGSHEIQASAPGFETVTLSVALAESRTETVVIPMLAPRPEPPRPAPVAGSIERTAAASHPAGAAVPRTRKYVGIGLTASGVVALGAGFIVAAKARSTYAEVKSLCGADLVCDTQPEFDRGHKLVGDARSQATIATALIAAGGVVAAAGAVVWLTAPDHKRAETAQIVPILDRRGIGLGVTGRF